MAKQKQPEPAWITAIKDLDVYQYRTVKMVIDGHNLTFQNQQSKRRNYIVWFVDGVWKGEYMSKDSLIGAKFGMPKMMRYSKANYEIDRMYHGKKHADKMKKEFGVKVYAYMNHWTSTSRLISSLKKTCTNFEVIES